MERSMSIIGNDGEVPWSDGHSTASDDNSSILFPSSSLWTPAGSMTRLEAGQLSPISTELEVAPVDSASCADSMSLHSRKTSCASTWSTSYGDSADGDEIEHDGQWDQEQLSNDLLAVPKLEPTEDEDFCMDDVKEAPKIAGATLAAKAKRPRGRPRKHPLTAQVASNKVTKGRSKTGCITCRRRKKKCDEAKPRCMNCEKNAVVCEGYNEKTLWKSGREKAEEERQAHQNLVSITMQPLFRGVETPEDMVFFNHYINHLSGVLTVESQHKNAFKDMLLQMAVEHRGLMHSILALASKHIDYDTPYGMKILSSNGKVSPASLLARSEFHHQQAMTKLYEDIAREGNKDVAPAAVNLAARYGQMLCLLLQSKAEGAHNGEHRVHLQAYKNLIQNSPPDDSAFLVFITEFFQLHIFADELIRFPDSAPRLAVENWEPWMPIQPARLIGVGDGLFSYLTQITTIRNTIRVNIQAGIDPVVDYASLYRAAEIDAAIREWVPHWPPGDSRERVGLLYKQMMWVYLFRTIYPPSASSSSVSFAPSALVASIPSLAPRPPLSPTSPTHSLHGQPTEHSSTGHASCSRDGSPPPIRYPPHHDSRITIAVDESLAILDSIKPSDPVQTLLLIPCLVIGCSCFAPGQQTRIRDAIRAVRGYTGLRNCDLVQEVLEEVWQLMDRGDWARVWDWQGVARGLGLDFSCA